MSILSEKHTYLSRNEEWTSIEDMPYWNWDKIMTTGDLKYIFKSCKGRVTEKTYDLWMDLQDQHIQEFGVDEMLQERNRIIKRLIDLNVQFIVKRERVLLNFIKIEEYNLQNLNTTHFKMNEVLDYMTSYKKFDIDPKQYSVVKWFYTLKNMSKNGKGGTR